MTETEYGTHFDFLCEVRLRQTDPFLHTCFRNSVFAIDRLLTNYKNIFPFFTDHTFEHSEQVIRYCNIIAGEDIINALCPDEIYILLMGAALHDVGMGISEADFNDLSPEIPGLGAYRKTHPGESTAEYTRVFHQWFSAAFIKKYSALFEIPSDEYTDCICRLASGHRGADLTEENRFPTDFVLPNGHTVNVGYLAALVRLADELDVTSDRNLLFDYTDVNAEWSEKQTMCYQSHQAIKNLEVRQNELVLLYDTDDAAVEQEILRTKSKVDRAFADYCDITVKRTCFTNKIQRILFQNTK